MSQQEKSLGQELKDSRQINRFTLRDVEDAIGVSNAYLSQLENDKINNPGANILYKLANLYQTDFELLLEKAGVIQKDEANHGKSISGVALRSQELSLEEEQALVEYLSFIRFKSKKPKNG